MPWILTYPAAGRILTGALAFFGVQVPANEPPPPKKKSTPTEHIRVAADDPSARIAVAAAVVASGRPDGNALRRDYVVPVLYIWGMLPEGMRRAWALSRSKIDPAECGHCPREDAKHCATIEDNTACIAQRGHIYMRSKRTIGPQSA